MTAQLPKRAALPLAKILATASCRCSKTGPRCRLMCHSLFCRESLGWFPRAICNEMKPGYWKWLKSASAMSCMKHDNQVILSGGCVLGVEKSVHHGPLARYVRSRVRMRREWRERFPSHHRLAIPTCITAHAWRTCSDACRDRLLAVSFEFGDGGKRSRHSRCMRKPQSYVSGKRPIWRPSAVACGINISSHLSSLENADDLVHWQACVSQNHKQSPDSCTQLDALAWIWSTVDATWNGVWTPEMWAETFSH